MQLRTPFQRQTRFPSSSAPVALHAAWVKTISKLPIPAGIYKLKQQVPFTPALTQERDRRRQRPPPPWLPTTGRPRLLSEVTPLTHPPAPTSPRLRKHITKLGPLEQTLPPAPTSTAPLRASLKHVFFCCVSQEGKALGGCGLRLTKKYSNGKIWWVWCRPPIRSLFPLSS